MHFLRLLNGLLGDFWRVFKRGKCSSPIYSFQNLSFSTLLRIRAFAHPPGPSRCHLNYCIGVLQVVPLTFLSHLQSVIPRAFRKIQLKFALYLVSVLGLKWFLITINKNLNSFCWHSMPFVIQPLPILPLLSPAIYLYSELWPYRATWSLLK